MTATRSLHILLLRLAGWIPDELMFKARSKLADGTPDEVVRIVLDAVLRNDVPILAEDARLLHDLAPTTPMKALSKLITPNADRRAPALDFAPTIRSQFSTEPQPQLLDLSVGRVNDLTDADEAAIAALTGIDWPVALWRVWRSSQTTRLSSGPVPVYLLQVDGDIAALPGVTAEVQGELLRAGAVDPQVETWTADVDLPAYQQRARGRSALLWAAEESRPVTVARVFDAYDPALGGRFFPDHATLPPGDESTRLLHYLDSGRVLAATTAKEPDIFSPEVGAVVPINFRTDGTWIWTDSVGYYLRKYRISPDQKLLDHIRGRSYAYVEPTAVAEHRAMAMLTAPRG